MDPLQFAIFARMATFRTRVALIAFAASHLLPTPTFGAATAPGDYYVMADQVEERLGPSPKAKSTNTLYKRQKVTVLEVQSGWARVSKYYDGQVEGTKGQVARWVRGSDLSPRRPADEKVAGVDTPLGRALKDSDNFAKHHAMFLRASQKLLDSRMCKLEDFRDNGGWMKSTNHAGSVYFAYCGGMTRSNRLYLDAATGLTFR